MFIDRKEHEALVAERDAAKLTIETITTDMTAAEAEITRLETEIKTATDAAAALKTENETLRTSVDALTTENTALKAENDSLKVENIELKKLPGAETARVKADKEQAIAGDDKANLATSDDKTFIENVRAVKEQYI